MFHFSVNQLRRSARHAWVEHTLPFHSLWLALADLWLKEATGGLAAVQISSQAIAQAEGISFVSRWPDSPRPAPENAYDVDHVFHDLYDRAQAATGMHERAVRRQRHYMIPQLLRRVAWVEGDFAEVGCFRGLSAYVTCTVLEELGRTEGFHIFDSFAGLSEPAGQDHSPLLPARAEGAPNPFACLEDEVRANLYPIRFVHYHPGWVPERFPDVADKRFAYVHVDVDLYEPTRDTVEFFWPRLSPGGVMLFDDFGTLYYPGARRTINEFFDGRRDAFIFETPSGSGAAIKLTGGDGGQAGALQTFVRMLRGLLRRN
ncbi:TylF/MycF/NovP-related O-methyltransferase [Methylobacterium sp. D54C]